jgi:ABC-type phosphate transport system auxiliary subunit
MTLTNDVLAYLATTALWVTSSKEEITMDEMKLDHLQNLKAHLWKICQTDAKYEYHGLTYATWYQVARYQLNKVKEEKALTVAEMQRQEMADRLTKLQEELNTLCLDFTRHCASAEKKKGVNWDNVPEVISHNEIKRSLYDC